MATAALPNHHLLDPNATAIPFKLFGAAPSPEAAGLFASLPTSEKPRANLSKPARDYLAGLALSDPDENDEAGAALWHHALGIAFSPLYLTENKDAVQGDYPRVPPPCLREDLEASAALGKRLANLLDTEAAVDGVDAPPIEPPLDLFGVPSSVTGGTLKPGNLSVEAGWGHSDGHRPVMPGRGRIIGHEAYEPDTEAAIRKALEATALPPDDMLARLGPPLDIYLNEVAFWACVPQAVWEYRIGGYQVIKKWLSYREHSVLGRALSADEVEYVTAMVRRLAAIVLMEPALNANYAKARDDAFNWSKCLNRG